MLQVLLPSFAPKQHRHCLHPNAGTGLWAVTKAFGGWRVKGFGGKAVDPRHMRGAWGDSRTSGGGHPMINHSAGTTVPTQPVAACQDNGSGLRPLKISLPKVQVPNCSQCRNCMHIEASPNCEVKWISTGTLWLWLQTEFGLNSSPLCNSRS